MRRTVTLSKRVASCKRHQKTTQHLPGPLEKQGERIGDKKVVRATLEQTTKDMQATHMTNATPAVPSYAIVHDRL